LFLTSDKAIPSGDRFIGIGADAPDAYDVAVLIPRDGVITRFYAIANDIVGAVGTVDVELYKNTGGTSAFTATGLGITDLPYNSMGIAGGSVAISAGNRISVLFSDITGSALDSTAAVVDLDIGM
jgi:hypothetical protein